MMGGAVGETVTFRNQAGQGGRIVGQGGAAVGREHTKVLNGVVYTISGVGP